VKDNVSSDVSTDELPAWVDLVQRIQKSGSIRSLPLTDQVIVPGAPDYDRIHALVRKALRPPMAKPTATPSPSATSSSSPRPSPTGSATPTADPRTAQDLAATC
jgi:hypothetical protein